MVGGLAADGRPIRIDLGSDTKTRPTQAMRQAMAMAEVGDEQVGEDPTTRALEERVASLLGKEAALFTPSGTMCNQIALAVLCRPGEEIIADKTAHIGNFESGGISVVARAPIRELDGQRGIFTAAQVKAALRHPVRHAPLQRVVSIEQTSNLGGGSIWTLPEIAEVAEVARGAGLLLHMDGARLLNAVVESGVSAQAYAAEMDSVWIDLSKGLGCPVGAVMAGSRDFIEDCWRWKQRLGGAMRQSGILAAAGIYALDNHVDRMKDDHANARAFAGVLAQVPGIAIDPANVQTNIVVFDVVGTGWHAPTLSDTLLEKGIRVGALGATAMRAVTHLDVDRAGTMEAAEALAALASKRPA
jgi:threonine aldolase